MNAAGISSLIKSIGPTSSEQMVDVGDAIKSSEKPAIARLAVRAYPKQA